MSRPLRLVLFCVLLGGCFTAGKRGGEAPMVAYDFGPPAPRLLAEPRRQPLALEVRAPLWFDTLGIDYRLAYQDAARLREYARARWVGPPAQLLQQRLSQQLDYLVAGQSRARCLVRLEITEFSQVFETAQLSFARLQGRAYLLDRSRNPLGDLHIDIQQAAETPDAKGGVAALTVGVARLGEQLLEWEKALAAIPAGAACFR